MMKMLSKILLISCLFVFASAGPRRRGSGRGKPNVENNGFALAKLKKEVLALRKEIDEIKNQNGVYLHVNSPQMSAANSEDEIILTDEDEMNDQDDGHDDNGKVQYLERATHIYMHMMMGQNRGMGTGMKMGMKMGMCPMMMRKMKKIRPDGYVYARCDVQGNTALPESERSAVHGTIYMKQKYNPKGSIEVEVDLAGFDSTSGHMHGMHIHEYGDISDGCQSLGGHYNPANESHGAPDVEERHMGDWGNIMCEDDGTVQMQFKDNKTTLMGPFTIIGRAIVIHHGPDDLGEGNTESSLVSGNAGGRMACCIIGQDRTPEPEIYEF